jgi:hypothetical protein
LFPITCASLGQLQIQPLLGLFQSICGSKRFFRSSVAFSNWVFAVAADFSGYSLAFLKGFGEHFVWCFLGFLVGFCFGESFHICDVSWFSLNSWVFTVAFR